MILQHRTGAQKVYSFIGGIQVISIGAGSAPVAGSDVSNVGQEIGIDIATEIAFNMTEIQQRGN